MKEGRWIAFISLVCVFFCITPRMASADGANNLVNKIPRRVFFGFSSKSAWEAIDRKDLFSLLPDFIYTRVSSLRAIVRVKDKGEADSLVLVDVKGVSEGDNDGGKDSGKIKKIVELKVELFNGKKPVLSRTGRFDVRNTDVERFTRFVNEVSKAIAPYMNKVKPKIKVVRSVREERVKRVVSKIEYADKLAKTFEFTLWTSGLTRFSQVVPYTFTSNKPIDRFSYIFPLVFDVGWYYQRNNGLLFSFFFDRNDDMSFGLIYHVLYESDGSVDDVRRVGVSRSENELYLGGIGYSYRSLDTIAAEFNIVQYLGGVRIRAIDPIEVYYRDSSDNLRHGLTISAGEVGWVFYSLLSLQSVFFVNPFPWLSLKVKIALNINPALLINSNLDEHYYSIDFNSIFFNFFQMGLALKI